jgi:hypothetical protein
MKTPGLMYFEIIRIKFFDFSYLSTRGDKGCSILGRVHSPLLLADGRVESKVARNERYGAINIFQPKNVIEHEFAFGVGYVIPHRRGMSLEMQADRREMRVGRAHFLDGGEEPVEVIGNAIFKESVCPDHGVIELGAVFSSRPVPKIEELTYAAVVRVSRKCKAKHIVEVIAEEEFLGELAAFELPFAERNPKVVQYVIVFFGARLNETLRPFFPVDLGVKLAQPIANRGAAALSYMKPEYGGLVGNHWLGLSVSVKRYCGGARKAYHRNSGSLSGWRASVGNISGRKRQVFAAHAPARVKTLHRQGILGCPPAGETVALDRREAAG